MKVDSAQRCTLHTSVNHAFYKLHAAVKVQLSAFAPQENLEGECPDQMRAVLKMPLTSFPSLNADHTIMLKHTHSDDGFSDCL